MALKITGDPKVDLSPQNAQRDDLIEFIRSFCVNVSEVEIAREQVSEVLLCLFMLFGSEASE